MADRSPASPPPLFGGVELAAVTAAFGQALHQAGIPVTPERSSRFARVVLLARPETVSELAALGRTTLLSSQDQIEVFDRVFAQVFRGIVDFAEFRGDSAAPPPPSSALPQGDTSPSASDRTGESEAEPTGSSGEPAEFGEPDDDEVPHHPRRIDAVVSSRGCHGQPDKPITALAVTLTACAGRR